MQVLFLFFYDRVHRCRAMCAAIVDPATWIDPGDLRNSGHA